MGGTMGVIAMLLIAMLPAMLVVMVAVPSLATMLAVRVLLFTMAPMIIAVRVATLATAALMTAMAAVAITAARMARSGHVEARGCPCRPTGRGYRQVDGLFSLAFFAIVLLVTISLLVVLDLLGILGRCPRRRVVGISTAGA